MHPHDMDPELLPWSAESEMAVLGCLLGNNAMWDQVGDLLRESAFYDAANRLIFVAIGTLIHAAKPADIFTVFDQLQKDGKADAAGGLPYLHDLASQVVSAGNARRYAEIVTERALMRGMIDAAAQVKDLATKPGLPVAERLDRAQGVLQGLQTEGGRAMPTSIDGSVVRLLDRLQAAADGTAPRGIPTGIPAFDRMTGGGLKGGKQIILAARPSVGKSSLAEQLCIHVALHEGHGAAFFSQEMSKDELTDRAIANIGRVELDRIISGQLQDNEWSRLTEAVEKLRNAPLYFDDQPALTLFDIAAKARMLKRTADIKLIVIDYLQLCGSSGKKAGDSRHHQIEEISRGLKNLARQLDICFISLSQLNRDVEKRANGRPVMSDLKESGSIEEDADIVMLLSRGQPTPSGLQIMNLDLPKNRQGRTGTVALAFEGAYQQWIETAAPVEFKPTAGRKSYTEDV